MSGSEQEEGMREREGKKEGREGGRDRRRLMHATDTLSQTGGLKKREIKTLDSSRLTLKCCRVLLLGNSKVGGKQEVRRDVQR